MRSADGRIELRPITDGEIEFARLMRNSNRHAFFDNRIVDQESHREWISRLPEAAGFSFYVIWFDGKPVGTISTTLHPDGSLEIGNGTLLDELKGHGIGTTVESMLHDPSRFCFGTYFTDNPQAAGAMRKAGWQPIPINRKTVHGIIHDKVSAG